MLNKTTLYDFDCYINELAALFNFDADKFKKAIIEVNPDEWEVESFTHDMGQIELLWYDLQNGKIGSILKEYLSRI